MKHKILISHEIPVCLFPFNSELNDYPYVLAHLLWEGSEYFDPVYAKFYEGVLQSSAYSILDNSCFELGESIPSQVLLEIYKKYKPTHLVLPDIMGSAKETIALTKNFLKEIEGESVKCMAVLQGKTLKEYEECLDYYNSTPQIDVIGVNYRQLRDNTTRFSFLEQMYAKGKINKKTHLLGCENPIEFKMYQHVVYRQLITSIDTSSPIVHGWLGNLYDEHKGYSKKPKDLLADNLYINLDEKQLECIKHNVELFKQYVNG